MNPGPLLQTLGNLCVGLAALVWLLPLSRLLADYAGKYPSDDRWVTPASFVLLPLWLLLLVAMLCVTATGGFDWLRVGRPWLYALTVAASFALATVTFGFIAFYIRPGFTPRFLYVPGVYLVPLTTALVVVLSLNPRLATVLPLPWVRFPWTIFTGLSLVVCVGFFGHRLVNGGVGGMINLARQTLSSRESRPDDLATISSLDPQSDAGFAELLALAAAAHDRATREAAAARLRALPDFPTRLAKVLERRPSHAAALEFIAATTLTPDEQQLLALPTRAALESFISEIPAPNYLPRSRQKELLAWGRKIIPVVTGKFSGAAVDFSPLMPAFEHALRPDDTRR